MRRLLPLRKRMNQWQLERRLCRAAVKWQQKAVRKGAKPLECDLSSHRVRVLGRWLTMQVLVEHGY